MSEDVQCLEKLVVSVLVVALVKMPVNKVSRFQSVTEELPATVEEPGCACAWLAIVVLLRSLECASGICWRRTTE